MPNTGLQAHHLSCCCPGKSSKQLIETRSPPDSSISNQQLPENHQQLQGTRPHKRNPDKCPNRKVRFADENSVKQQGSSWSSLFPKHSRFRQSLAFVMSLVRRSTASLDTDLDEAMEKSEEGSVDSKSLTEACLRRKHPRASMEGQLLKFTNIMKGYQYRWFVLNAETGVLEYYKNKAHRKLKPRGIMSLMDATVTVPSGNKHGFMFTVHGHKKNIYRLKAYDERERQLWVERIRATAEHQKQKLGAPPMCSSSVKVSRCFCRSHKKRPSSMKGLPPETASVFNLSVTHAKEYYKEAEELCFSLHLIILELPSQGEISSKMKNDLLLMRATSTATLTCVHDCIYLLQLAKLQLYESTSQRSSLVTKSGSAIIPTILDASVGTLPNPADEVPDSGAHAEPSSENIEVNKSVIVHLLSQLKLGMDLSKVVLPTFILEKRSLLELFTDCLSHPDKLMRVAKIKSPEKRFLSVLEWYLTSFHCGRLGTTAKKPYNPVIGETFHCSWHVMDLSLNSKDILMTFTAEQVSHHPPVSAFYAECKESRMQMNGSIQTKSKFMGMSVGVALVGKVMVHLEEFKEVYVFSLPSAYCRSILTVPWVELGDKVQLVCEKTGYLANINFHTKPMIGGKVHHISVEAKHVGTGEVICKVVGEWNATLEFTFFTSDSKDKKSKPKAVIKTVNVDTLTIFPKYVRPIEQQKEYESRRLWLNVTKALTLGNIDDATHHKQQLEKIQREEEERRRQLNITYEAKFFRQVNETWLYKTIPDDFLASIKV